MYPPPGGGQVSNVLVSGCAGFIGSNAASLLLDEGHIVWGVDSPPDSPGARLREWRLDRLLGRSYFSFERPDVSDIQPLKALFRDAHQRNPISAVLNLSALAGVGGSV